MKPLRGSNRDASKAPNTKGISKKITDEQKQKPEAKKHDSKDHNAAGTSTQPKKAPKRKAESHPSAPVIIKGQENWKQISVSSVAELEKVLDLSILAVLSRKQANKKEVQEHLNALKKRFLDYCSTLKVPRNTQKQEGAAYRLQEEIKKSAAEKQTLGSLDENLRAVVSTLEKNEQEMNALEHQCSVLRNSLQDTEEEADEVFHRREKILDIPLLLPAKDKITLEAELRKAVPDHEAETMARKLGEILQNSESLQDAKELMLLAHRHLDELFSPHPLTLPHC